MSPVSLMVTERPSQMQDTDVLSASAYEAFSAMLRINTSLRLVVPSFNDAVVDEKACRFSTDAH
jgi:hypothetical protein